MSIIKQIYNTSENLNDEVILWQNSRPNDDFTEQDVTLNEPITNFKYIKIVCAKDNTSTTVSEITSSIIEDTKKFIIGGLNCGFVNNSTYFRGFSIANYGAGVSITNCLMIGKNSGYVVRKLIPLQIIGLIRRR